MEYTKNFKVGVKMICPNCGHKIPEEFYCTGCGHVPPWARNAVEIAAFEAGAGWKLEATALRAIDDIVRESITDLVAPEFMAPPVRSAQERREAGRCTA